MDVIYIVILAQARYDEKIKLDNKKNFTFIHAFSSIRKRILKLIKQEISMIEMTLELAEAIGKAALAKANEMK